MSSHEPYYTSRQDEIDLREMFLVLLKHWKGVCLTGVAFGLLAAVYAFFIANPVFESSALLVPTQTSATDQLSSAAALFGGKKLGSGDVDLYQSLLTSRTVMHNLLRSPIRDMSDTGNGKIKPLYSVLNLDTTNALGLWRTVKGLAGCIQVGTKESGEGGILQVTISFGSPWLAQQIAKNVLDLGQEELRQVRMERYEVSLSRLSAAVDKAKTEWDSTAKRLAGFRDRNRSISLPDQMLELSQLEMEKQEKEQTYLLARREYELQQLEREKATPPMMILDPADLPPKKSKPKELLLISMGIFLGLTGAVVYVLGRNAFTSSSKQITE